MKKIFSKIKKGYSVLKNTKVKLLIIAVLTVVMLIDLNPFFLKAGRETLVYTFENGVYTPFAFDNNRNGLAYYGISKMGGHIAYCMDYNVRNAPNGTGLQYIRNVKTSKVVAVLMNGYPTKSAKQLGLSDDHEAYLATQMAIWEALNNTNDTKGSYFSMDKIQPNLKYSKSMDSLLTNAKRVAKQLLQKEYDPGTFKLDSSKAKVNYEYNDSKIKIGPYKIATTGYSDVSNINVAISGQPTGTLLVDKNDKQKSVFAKNEDIYILINKNAPAGSLKISASSKANKYVGIVYGSGSWQNFVFLDTEQVDVSANATASWEESKGNINIVKKDQDNKPIQGAEFALINAAGTQVATGKTDANGNLQFNNLNLGNYAVTEISVPDGYIIQKSSYPVVVTRSKTQTIEVQNTKVKGVLQITKLEKNSKTPIANAVFEVYDANGKVVEKLTTDANGIATSKELEKGTYTYKEVSVPDGYIMDTEVRTFSISETLKAVRQTVTNEKIVGELQIVKIGDDGEVPVAGAEFEVYDSNKKVVAKITTDKDGKASVKDLAKGTYTYKEVKSPEDYELDPKEYTFKIETLKQIVEGKVTDKKIYGKLKIEKVDENNKPIQGAKFQILDEENKVIATVETDKDGVAICENLPVGKYKYKEVDTPYLYVLDEKEYNFEITSENREVDVKVVNQRAKGIIKIVKIDKDSKAAIPNAKFNIIDKATNEIVDAILTDENGVARTKALPTGEYMYQEVEIPDEYIIDTKTYDLKIKKNNEMIEKKVSNEHKKLPVTGGFLSTNGIIIVIVVSVSVIGYIVFKIIQSKKNGPQDPITDYGPINYDPNVTPSLSMTDNNEKINQVENTVNTEEEKINNLEDRNEISNDVHDNVIESTENSLNEEDKTHVEEIENTNDNVTDKEDKVDEENKEDKEDKEEDNSNTMPKHHEDDMLDLTPKYNSDEIKNEDDNL